jgi:hypothetical protein
MRVLEDAGGAVLGILIGIACFRTFVVRSRDLYRPGSAVAKRPRLNGFLIWFTIVIVGLLAIAFAGAGGPRGWGNAGFLATFLFVYVPVVLRRSRMYRVERRRGESP